jgi:hypothetical protein
MTKRPATIATEIDGIYVEYGSLFSIYKNAVYRFLFMIEERKRSNQK